MRMIFLFLFVGLLGFMPLSAQQKEFRGAWITTAWNLNFPSKPGLSVGQQQQELIALLNTAQRLGLNAVLFQVRPEGDAFYPSRLDPWSRFLTGTQGRDPGYDPLAFLISEAKKRNIEVHAWLNPYRAATNANAPRAENHFSRRFGRYAYRNDSMVWMDPGSEAVRNHIVAVVQDLVRRYDLAGIHYDDYFYPYPKPGKKNTSFPDRRTYEEYKRSGGSLSFADWRRENVNKLIRQTHQAVKAIKPNVKFGVSPFGIYTKGFPDTVRVELDQYNDIYADPVKWIREGWVDYLAPQLYWADNSPQSFSALLKWWRDPYVNPRNIPIYPGIAVARMSPPHNWAPSEIIRQVEWTRRMPVSGVPNGKIFWNIKALHDNHKGLSSQLKSKFYQNRAATP
ncbi:family 10 glycosylhydrolase [Oscillatoria amoena NRMC-F 0135]|nr:family 10 glycosylhydrolase [Oscillatoria laete-virens]MDL5045800.1 family 10 glycosylhydrolase [Oscillatoria amoena NRMC-F 0135]MDL5055171.1 family 10 glycosylhydrolase [Oscillatoria laete-virens NRMC-F 0139]